MAFLRLPTSDNSQIFLLQSDILYSSALVAKDDMDTVVQELCKWDDKGVEFEYALPEKKTF